MLLGAGRVVVRLDRDRPGQKVEDDPEPPDRRPPGGGAPGPAPGTVRRLTRRTDNKILAGVASGIAAYLGIEAWIVRIGFVILVPFGGFGGTLGHGGCSS